MAWIAEEGPALPPMAQVLGHTGPLAPVRDQTAHRKAPGGIEIIHHPIVAVQVWQLLDDVGQRGGAIGTGAGLAQIPHDVPCWYHKRSERRPHPMPEVFLLALGWFPRGNGLGGICALETLHAGCFIGAHAHPPLLQEAEGMQV